VWRSDSKARATIGRLLLALLISSLASLAASSSTAQPPSAGDVGHDVSQPVRVDAPRVDLSNIAVAPGYRLDVDSVGYDLPTSVAIIPEPFDGEGAPVYFVAELQGTIKVVTRDRQVHDFAAVPTWGRQGHDLHGTSQQGLAGLCLAPEHGYLFATFT